MTKDNPSKKERIEAARKRTEKNIKRTNENREEAQHKEPLPKPLSWLRKKKKNGDTK